MKTKKPIEAKRMWLDADGRILWHTADKHSWRDTPRTQVGVIDLSDIPALETQVAKALADHDWKYHDGSGLPAPVDGYLPEARAVLSSLGLIPARRRKK